MTEPVQNTLNWFDPVTDMGRAARFYGEIFGVVLEPGPSGPGYRMAMFPSTNGVNGALMQGDGYVSSHHGSVLYLNGGDDLSTVLHRVEGAGGRVLAAKADIGDGLGFTAYFEDTEGNRVGLHSMA